ncbi:AI-2E family transporter [Caldimonas tepidiphila]|uniref:AI-2E family transporter n=1 Tax=Caldimonas tepidiphila TaxID=2315841 RepID=UPI000E5C4184|nr:AI-2E family transporter [Caldimonas tepidiphila]
MPAPALWAARGLLLIAMIFLLQFAQSLLLPLVVAVILTFVLSEPVRRLRRLGIPEMVGAGLVVAALLGVVGLAGSALAGPAADWWQRAPSNLRQLVETFDRVRAELPLLAPPRKNPRSATPPPDPVKEKLASEGFALTRTVMTQVVTFAISAAATVILLYFLLASEHWLLSRTVEAIPRRRTRGIVLAGVRRAQREIGTFLATMSLINLGVGAATGVVMMSLGLPNPGLWAAMAGVMNFVPYLGPLIVLVLLLLAGVLTFGSFGMMVAPAAAFLLINVIEANFVTPMILGRRLSLSPLSVFLSVMVWGWLWGIAGALIAVPLLLGLRAVCRYWRRLKLLCVYLEGDRNEAPSLKSLLRAKRRSAGARGT